MWLKNKNISISLGLLIVAISLWSQFSEQSPLHVLVKRFDFIVYDLRYRLSVNDEPMKNNIAIIDIDEKSLAAEGRWPWSRATVARLVDRLAEEGVLVVAFDVVFSEPERNVVSEILLGIEQEGAPVDDAFTQRLSSLVEKFDNDQRFAKVLGESTDIVLGYFFNKGESVSVGGLPISVYELDESQQDLVVSEVGGYTSALPLLVDAAIGTGFTSNFRDVDGVVRRTPLVMRYENSLYSSLALEAVRVFTLEDGVRIGSVQQGNIELMENIQISDKVIPTDAIGQVLIPYRAARSFPYYSATDVLNGTLKEGVLENSIVFVGTSSTGLSDLRTTPIATELPGVEVHANIVWAILEGQFPFRPDWEAGLSAFLIVVIGSALSILIPRLGPVAMILIGLASIVTVILGNIYIWQNFLFDLSMAALLLMIFTILVLNLAVGFLSENDRRREIKGMFGQYVPEAHVDAMLKDPGNVTFDGESKELSVLFSDIRSFTTISESLNAAELKSLLNRYFTPITECIFDYNGTIDKYVGDMVMAFWGAPMNDPNHAENAIASALRMLEICEELKPEFRELGLPEISVGIGINTGFMNVGDMGSTFRKAYTVLGDAVNLGARLESITKFYGLKLLVGEATMEGQEKFLFRHVDRIKVKGKNEAVDVYEPINFVEKIDEEQRLRVEVYHRALSDYFKQNWDSATERFLKLKEQEEKKLYDVYIDRIQDLKNEELPKEWDGVFVHQSK